MTVTRAFPRQWWSTWPEGHSRGMAPVVATSKGQSRPPGRRPLLAYSNPSPSSHGSEMVKSDRRGLILTKPNQKKEQLGRLSSILVCELGVMNYVLNTIHGWGISARAHVHTALLYLRNGLTDCVQIWYVGWRSLSKCFPQVMGGVGHLCTCARAPPSPYLRIRVANCAKI